MKQNDSSCIPSGVFGQSMRQKRWILLNNITVVLVVLTLGMSCSDDVSYCDYGATSTSSNYCSFYPRNIALSGSAENQTLYSSGWASDAIVRVDKNGIQQLPTAASVPSDAHRDLWGAWDVHIRGDYLYATGYLENSLGVFPIGNSTESNAFSVYQACLADSCEGFTLGAEPSLASCCYKEMVEKAGSKIYRNSTLASIPSPGKPTTLLNILKQPKDIESVEVTLNEKNVTYIYVAASGSSQVSLFRAAEVTNNDIKSIDLTYVGGIGPLSSPSKLALVPSPATDPTAIYLFILGSNGKASCTSRTDFLTVARHDLTDDSIEILQELRSGFETNYECSLSKGCGYVPTLKGAWDVAIPVTTSSTVVKDVFVTSRCHNSVESFSFDNGGTNSLLTLTQSYGVTGYQPYADCIKKPANLGFKGLAVTDSNIYVASWETGYIFDWVLGAEEALLNPTVACALGEGLCVVESCSERYPDWYINNEATASPNAEGTMRPFPYEMSINGTSMYVSLDRNGGFAKCRIADTSTDTSTYTSTDTSSVPSASTLTCVNHTGEQ